MSVPIEVLESTPALSELSSEALVNWAIENDLPAYRGRQLYHALATNALQDVCDFSGFPLDLRKRVADINRTRTLRTRLHLRSTRDTSEKVLFELRDGLTVESVLIPGDARDRRPRYTVCVSSQVGCPAGCTFCATGLGGFSRNLSGAEICDQVMYFASILASRKERVSNVVFMGMGEPLLNVAGVRDAVARLTDINGFRLGARHLTVSTVGIVPQLRKFAEWAGQVNLALSLHAPNDELRTRLVPYNKRFPIASLLDAVGDYIAQTRRRVSFEYVLLQDVNDAPTLAIQLADLLRRYGGMAHVNLIPWNPIREASFSRSTGPDAVSFAALLRERGINATIRYSKGLDISAACGQLREQIQTAT